MQIIDWIILILVGLSVVTGIMRGLVKEIIALSIWFVAAYLAYKFAYILQPWASKYFHDPMTIGLISMAGIFLAVMILGSVAGAVLGLILKQVGLSGIDRLLGGCFGFIRGIFIICLMLTTVRAMSVPLDNYTNTSIFYNHLLPIVNKMTDMIPHILEKVQYLQGEVINKIEPLENLR